MGENIITIKKRARFIVLVIIISYFILGSAFLINIRENEIDKSPEILNKKEFIEDKQNLPSTSASEVWSDVWGSSEYERGNDIVVDSEGNSYIIGTQNDMNIATYNILLLKYNRTGHYEWNITWGIDNDYEYANAIAIDFEGNLYVAGNTYEDMLIIKFNSSGVEEWNITWSNSDYNEEAYDIDLDSEGNIYVAGRMQYDAIIDEYYDLCLVKFNNTGHYKWHVIKRNFPYNNIGTAVNVYSSNEIYITGSIEVDPKSPTPLGKAYIAKYNSLGSKIWEHRWGTNTYPYHNEYFNDVGIDSNNDVYAAGVSSTGANSILLVKYQGDTGKQLWNKTWNGGMDVSAKRLIIDKFDNLFTVGSKIALGPDFDDVIFVNFNSSGVCKWYKLWGNNKREYGNGIYIDSLFNIYITGYRNQNAEDSLIVKYCLTPGIFTLSSNADSGNIDYDGNFNLTWTNADEAFNYSLYWSEYFFNNPNSSVELLTSGNTNRTFCIKDLPNGTYYYRIWAYNSYGNKSSDCLFIQVIKDKPRSFSIYTNAEPIESDGLFDITWDISISAKNYSIFYSNKYIFEVNDTHFPALYKDITSTSQHISGLNAGDCFFRVVAYNEQGNRTCNNCIHVYIQYLPGKFLLIQSSEQIFENKEFNLTWTRSLSANYYNLYQSSHNITKFNETVFKYPYDFFTNSCRITGLPSGTYFFIVVAFNNNGNSTSNCVNLIVLEQSSNLNPANDDDDNNDDGDGNLIPIGNYHLLFLIIGIIISIFMSLRRRNLKFQKRNC